MSAAAPDLSMVVPTYNERECLPALVDAVFGACDRAGVHLELIIVDDGSPDGTGALADELAKTRRMKVVHRSGKLGLGTAVMAGFKVATSSVAGVMDADFSHPPDMVPVLLRSFVRTGADVVVASRYVPGGGVKNWPFSRRLISRVACVIARPLSPVADASSGFFIIRRDLAMGAPVRAHGFKICLELIVRGWATSLVEVPYTFEDRRAGSSKMGTAETVGFLKQLGSLAAYRWSRRRPRRSYRQISVSEKEAWMRG